MSYPVEDNEAREEAPGADRHDGKGAEAGCSETARKAGEPQPTSPQVEESQAPSQPPALAAEPQTPSEPLALAAEPVSEPAVQPPEPTEESTAKPAQESPAQPHQASAAPPGEIGEQAEAVADADMLTALNSQLEELRGLGTDLQDRLERIEDVVGAAKEQVGVIPQKVRTVGNKVVEALTTPISESRYRSLLLDLLRIYDMVDQALRSLSTQVDSSAPERFLRGYEILRTQIRQILAMNGLSEIPAKGVFDPTAHCAVQRIRCDDEALAGQIHSVTRPGFSTEQSVLRYADVVVFYYQPPEKAAAKEEANRVEIKEPDVGSSVELERQEQPDQEQVDKKEQPVPEVSGREESDPEQPGAEQSQVT